MHTAAAWFLEFLLRFINDAFSTPKVRFIASHGRTDVRGKGMRQAVFAYFEVMPKYFPGGQRKPGVFSVR
jgi:hypothetical protein